MNNIFHGCSSLSTLPDISKWNTSNVKYMECMFSESTSLSHLPHISKWNSLKIDNMINLQRRYSLHRRDY